MFFYELIRYAISCHPGAASEPGIHFYIYQFFLLNLINSYCLSGLRGQRQRPAWPGLWTPATSVPLDHRTRITTPTALAKLALRLPYALTGYLYKIFYLLKLNQLIFFISAASQPWNAVPLARFGACYGLQGRSLGLGIPKGIQTNTLWYGAWGVSAHIIYSSLNCFEYHAVSST